VAIYRSNYAEIYFIGKIIRIKYIMTVNIFLLVIGTSKRREANQAFSPALDF
jgi:hypothetical protein